MELLPTLGTSLALRDLLLPVCMNLAHYTAVHLALESLVGVQPTGIRSLVKPNRVNCMTLPSSCAYRVCLFHIKAIGALRRSQKPPTSSEAFSPIPTCDTSPHKPATADLLMLKAGHRQRHLFDESASS